MIPEVAMNPLASRLTSLFERDIEDRINFKSFVSGLSVFSEKARPEVRQRGAIMLLRRRQAEQRQPWAAKDVGSL
jgi:Ca2+-binding EF-hand superfamily protein